MYSEVTPYTSISTWEMNDNYITCKSMNHLYRFSLLHAGQALAGGRRVRGFSVSGATVLIMSTANHAVNFLLYIIRGQQFRRQFVAIICCWKQEELSRNIDSSLRGSCGGKDKK